MERPPVPAFANWPALVILALTGFVAALFGTYWDDAWHTEQGRDSFLAAPHLALYLGITITGGALAGWAALSARRAGVRATLGRPGLVLSLAGAAVTLLAGPGDNAWHLAFGRDSVIWSPPHMLGVAGTLAIAAGLLLELSAGGTRFSRICAVIAASAVLGVGTIPVLEYDTDVPQFDLALYLPVLALGSGFALGLARMALRIPFAASSTALVHAAVMIVIAAASLAAGLPAPTIPLLLVPALALDLAARRLHPLALAGLVAVALHAAYVPYLNWLKSGVYLEAADVLVSLPLTVLAFLVAFTLTGQGLAGPAGGLPARRATGAIAVVLLLLSAPPPALGHDPGQGEQLTTADLTAESLGYRATLEGAMAGHCDDLRPRGLVARRSGNTVRAPLRPTSRCGFRGDIGLPDRGRWFLYADLEHRGDSAETWIPVRAGTEEKVSEPSRAVYFPPEVSNPLTKPVAGAAAYGLLAAILVAIPVLYRRQLAGGEDARADAEP